MRSSSRSYPRPVGLPLGAISLPPVAVASYAALSDLEECQGGDCEDDSYKPEPGDDLRLRDRM